MLRISTDKFSALVNPAASVSNGHRLESLTSDTAEHNTWSSGRISGEEVPTRNAASITLGWRKHPYKVVAVEHSLREQITDACMSRQMSGCGCNDGW